ncbi:MAG: hypothetical protein HYU84_06605, partial [Chloroflexi bacterium]|nr:hypothetical protein [Chloroflexota bacterium]
MDQTNQTPPEETNPPEPAQRTSIGLKLTLIAVGLLLVGFIVYTIISIRIGQGDLIARVEADLQNETDETINLILLRLSEARNVATNLSLAVETGTYNEA